MQVFISIGHIQIHGFNFIEAKEFLYYYGIIEVTEKIFIT